MQKITSLSLVALILSSFTFFSLKKTPKKIGDFVWVEGGVVQCMIFNEKDSVGSFYMLHHEVTNVEYREFLNDPQTKAREDYQDLIVDSLGWRDKLSFCEPMVRNYHSHPAYNNYPVVNINKASAEAYCAWLTVKLNELYQEKNGLEVEVRLPSKMEWIKGAKGGFSLSPYPWGGPFLRNNKGQWLCNFKTLGADHIYYDYENERYYISEEGMHFDLNANSFYTTPYGSYPENAYGLYDMSGNVAEMIKEDGIAMGGSWNSPGGNVSVESTMPFENRSKEVGFRPILTIKKKN